MSTCRNPSNFTHDIDILDVGIHQLQIDGFLQYDMGEIGWMLLDFWPSVGLYGEKWFLIYLNSYVPIKTLGQ